MASDRFSFRLGVVLFAAASAGLSVALISIAKVLLVATALVVLLTKGQRRPPTNSALATGWTPRLVVLILMAFACSLWWTSAPMDHALGVLGKYGKFLTIPALLVVVRNRTEASWALVVYAGAQAVLLLSSWLLYFQVPVPWATSRAAMTSYAVFSSYLDQGIMSAVVAAVFWHLKSLAPSRGLYYAALALSLVALGNVFLLFTGRTGHLVGVAMISLAIVWSLPKRYRLPSLLLPPMIFAAAFFTFDNVAQRFSGAKNELSAYAVKPEAVTSTGVRLSFWKTSVELIAREPLKGSGVGSWATEYNTIQDQKTSQREVLQVGSNPHQEFLMWGVQLGLGGILLLSAFLLAACRDLQKLPEPVFNAGFSVVMALALSCLFNSSLYDAYIGDFFCLSLGILLTYGIHSRSVRSLSVQPENR